MKKIVEIKELDVENRINSFDEVALGYTKEEAVKEALRCFQCKDPKCIAGCPVQVDIKKFIYQIIQEDFIGAYNTIRSKNNFPCICGRVCPAEYQCRKACVLTKKTDKFASEEAINIGFLERFTGDYGKEKNKLQGIKKDKKSHEKKVAVIGSGPAGLCVAGELARNGVKVTMFEGLHKTGGVLRYGIPRFRLPRNILDFEIEYIKSLGVQIIKNYIIGKTASIDKLFEQEFSAVFLGVGAGVPLFLGIKGENLCNVYSANEFLTRINLMSAHKFPQYNTPVNIGKRVIVIGGGNTAMDAARSAVRLQKMNNIQPCVTLFYRRTETEMPARKNEVEHAKQEGISFKFLVMPKEFLGNENGYVSKVKLLKCKLGEPDVSGRMRPVIIPDSDFIEDCDQTIVAIGLQSNRIVTSATPSLKINKYGDLIVNTQTMETNKKNVFAGGDIVGGQGTIIEAMGMGKKAAKAILKSIFQ